MAVAKQLEESSLTGKRAHRYGSPDHVMLVSGGPPSHLARWSLIAGPTTKRVVVRQPSRTLQPGSEPHSPLEGNIRLIEAKSILEAEVEEWKHGSWYHSVTLRAKNLEDLFKKMRASTDATPFQQTHGIDLPHAPFWAGAMAYDLVQWTQPLALQHPPVEKSLLAVLWCVEQGVVVDHHNDEAAVFGASSSWCDEARACLPWDGKPVDVPAAKPTRESVTHTDETHQDNIEAVRQGITNGQVYQVNIGKHWQGSIDHPYAVFQRLLRTNPAPFSAYAEADDLGFALASSSPESLLVCDETSIRTSPIKGTCPQGTDETASANLRSNMIDDGKERAEHRMLVDLMRNDLTQISVPGSVGVERFDVEAYANVQHLVSHISGVLKPKTGGGEALQALFPGGSITGCPRTMVCAVIDELEQMPRSFWTGSMGFIDVHSGQASWNILIRTLEAHKEGRNWSASVGAGGGITIASDPSKEVEEAAWKGAALRVAAGWMSAEHLALPTGRLGIHPIEAPTVPESHPNCGAIQTIDEVLKGGQRCDVLFVDNLDSFSLNIADAVAKTGRNATVLEGRSPRHERLLDPVHLHELIERLEPTHLVLGPGPGSPDDCKLTMAMADLALAGQFDFPVLGICLGHQALAQADGRRVEPAPHGPVHGVPTPISHDGTGLFVNQASDFLLTRYNSLVVVDDGEHALRVNAVERETGLIMGLHHPNQQIHSLQIHPESIGSPEGSVLLEAFLDFSSDG